MGKSVLKKMYSGMSAGMLSFFFAAVLFSAGCKNPVKNSSDSKKDPDLVLKELQIHRKSVNLKNWTVEIPEGKASVSAADVKAVFNISGVVLTIKEGTVSIEKGKTKKINLEAAPVKGKHKAWSQSVSVRRAEGSVSNLELKSLKIFGKAVNTDNWTVEIPEDNGVLVASNVEAVFNIPVENLIIEEGVIRLEKGEIKTATLKVAAVTGVHNGWSHAVSVKRAGEADLILKTLRIHKQNVDISNWTVEIPSSKAAVSSADVEAQFNITGAAVKVKNEPVSIASGATENVTLEVSAVAGKHKAWSQVVAVKRAKAATVNIIDIKGIYVDKKLVTNYAKTVELTKNSAEIKITVPANANYQTVTIDGKPAAYTASPDGTVFDSYTHTLTDIPAGEKEVIINITDTRFTPASLQKKIKLNYAGTSAYTPAKIKTVFIGDKDYTEENIDGAEAELTEGTPLTLDFKFIKAPPAGKEKIRVTVDSLSEEKAVAGNSVTFQFLPVTTGTHTVKIERLRADGNAIKTFNLTVKYLQKQKKITVESIEIKAGSENFIFDKKPFSQYKLAAMEYGNAEITTEADSIDMTINMEDPKDVSISVSNGAVQKNFKHGVKQAISLNRGGNNLKIEFTKSGFKTLIYKLNVKSDFVEISDITVAGTSYTWENFKALTAPIEVSSDKTDISVTWVNEGTPSRVSLEKKGSSNNLFSISGKTATAVNVPLIPGENEFTITVHFPELKWKRKTFKIKSMFAQNPDSNADFSEVVAEWYYQPPLNPQKAERPLSGEDVNVAVLYVKPESAEAKGVSLTKPASAVFSKTQYDGEQGWYKAEFNVRSGDKISYTITAKDGTVKAHNFNGGKGITMKKYLEGGYLRYGYHNDIDFNGGDKAVFDSAAYTAEINAESAKISNEGENKGKVFFIFKVFEFDGIEALSFAAPFKLEKDKGVKRSYRTYLISADLSGVNAGENVELDIPIKYNNVLSGKTTLIRTYKVKVNKH